MSKILYPIFKLPSENDEEKEPVPTWIKWWMINNYKKRNWILSEILTGNPLTLENSVETKFYLPPLPRGNSKQVQYSGKNLCTEVKLQSSENIVFYFNKNLLEKTFTISFIPSEALINNTLYLDKSNGTVVAGSISGSANTRASKTITLTDEVFESLQSATWLNFRLYKGGASFAVPTEAMIQNGSTATVYEPYVGGTASPNPSYPQAITNVTGNVEVLVSNSDNTESQTYTFPLGTQRMYLGDYLADDGIHHVRKQIELDGSNDEEWQRNGTTQGYSVLADNVGGTANTSVIPKILCNKLIAVKQSAIYGGTANNGISSQSDTQRIYVRINETITTVELLKQWLAENPITVEYELATEEITPYTTEQQQAYDEIKQALSYEEQTNISGSSDESNPLFEVQYYMENESEGE